MSIVIPPPASLLFSLEEHLRLMSCHFGLAGSAKEPWEAASSSVRGCLCTRWNKIMLLNWVNYRDGGHWAQTHFFNTGAAKMNESLTRCSTVRVELLKGVNKNIFLPSQPRHLIIRVYDEFMNTCLIWLLEQLLLIYFNASAWVCFIWCHWWVCVLSASLAHYSAVYASHSDTVITPPRCAVILVHTPMKAADWERGNSICC